MKNLLDNNSKEMQTVVETFIIEETAELIYDNEQLDKWNSLVNELGLKGQTQIIKKDKSPIPFMHVKQGLKNALETLCPRKVDVKDYNATPIPVEILDLVALSMREKYFHKIQIWYDDKNPDPVCMGFNGQWYSYNATGNFKTLFATYEDAKVDSVANGSDKEPYFTEYGTLNYYLLGKWADVKRSFADLVKMATDRFIQEQGHEYRKTIKYTQRNLDDLEQEAFDRFGSDVNGNDSLPF